MYFCKAFDLIDHNVFIDNCFKIRAQPGIISCLDSLVTNLVQVVLFMGDSPKEGALVQRLSNILFACMLCNQSFRVLTDSSSRNDNDNDNDDKDNDDMARLLLLEVLKKYGASKNDIRRFLQLRCLQLRFLVLYSM